MLRTVLLVLALTGSASGMKVKETVGSVEPVNHRRSTGGAEIGALMDIFKEACKAPKNMETCALTKSEFQDAYLAEVKDAREDWTKLYMMRSGLHCLNITAPTANAEAQATLDKTTKDQADQIFDRLDVNKDKSLDAAKIAKGCDLAKDIDIDPTNLTSTSGIAAYFKFLCSRCSRKLPGSSSSIFSSENMKKMTAWTKNLGKMSASPSARCGDNATTVGERRDSMLESAKKWDDACKAAALKCGAACSSADFVAASDIQKASMTKQQGIWSGNASLSDKMTASRTAYQATAKELQELAPNASTVMAALKNANASTIMSALKGWFGK